MRFTKIDESSKSLIGDYFKKENYSVCDFTLGCLYMWADYFEYEFCIENGFLFIRGNDIDDPATIAYAVPLGEGSVLDGVKMLENYEKGRGAEKIVFNAVPESVKLLLESENALCKYLPEWSDYVYNAEDLATLVGHRYNKKRNLVHQFENLYPGYSFSYITNENIGEVKEAYKFFSVHTQDTATANYENRYVMKMLSDYFTFGFLGGVLKVEGKVAAFCIGEIIKDTLYVHIEKADISFKGAYQMINMLFAKEIFSSGNIKFINREEDLGDPGLRQTKLSYYPAFLQNKYSVEIKF